MILEDGKNSVNCSPPASWITPARVNSIDFYSVRTESEDDVLRWRAKMLVDHTIPFRRAYFPDLNLSKSSITP